MRKKLVYGNVRVSTKDQNKERQLFALREFGIEPKSYSWTSFRERILTAPHTSG